MPFVLDASTALAWHFEDESSDAAEEIAERSFVDQVVVPHHWFIEVASAVLKGERRDRTDAAASAWFFDRLRALEAEVDVLGPEGMFGLVPLARAHRLSIYDAAYLELAERRGLPLATFDEPLALAARSVGVEVIGGERKFK
jgi:predicted nucleic acid-binding protein